MINILLSIKLNFLKEFGYIIYFTYLCNQKRESLFTIWFF